MRTDPGFPSDQATPTRPRWRIVFDASTLANQRVRANRVGQREAAVTVDNEDADAAYVASVESATATSPGARLQLSYNGTNWHTQFRGVVTSPVYSQGRVTINLRVVPVAYYPTRRVERPLFNHLPQPEALVTGAEDSVRVPTPRAPGT